MLSNWYILYNEVTLWQLMLLKLTRLALMIVCPLHRPTTAPAMPAINKPPTALHPWVSPHPHRPASTSLYYVMSFIPLSPSDFLALCKQTVMTGSKQSTPNPTQHKPMPPMFIAAIQCLCSDCSLSLFFVLHFSKIFVQRSTLYTIIHIKNVGVFIIHPLLCSLYICCLLSPSPKALNPLKRKRLLDRSHVSLMWALNVMAIQFQDKKPSLSLDPRMQSVALGPSTHNG